MDGVIDAVRKSICSSYDVELLDDGSLLIHTGKYFDDGDELHIVLARKDGGYDLTDEGHTLMWMSYEEYNFTPLRTEVLQGIIRQNGIRLDGGRIYVPIDDPEQAGAALQSLEQAIIQVADMRRLSRQNVASTFMEDLRAAFLDSPFGSRCEFGKKVRSGENILEPDIYVDDERPVLIFGVNNSERAKETVINLLYARSGDQRYRTIVVIDDDAEISAKDRKRLINTADRPIEGLDDVQQVTSDFVSARFMLVVYNPGRDTFCMKYRCNTCGYIYDEEEEGVPFADLPDDWICPICGEPKSEFSPVERFAGKPLTSNPQLAANIANMRTSK